jgi:hypothetical protein
VSRRINAKTGTNHPFGNDPAKVRGYRDFWNRSDVARPLVGFTVKSWFPLHEFKASASWQSRSRLLPDMVVPGDFMDDQERILKQGEVIADDILRGACPSEAVPWLCGMLGASLRILPGSVLAEARTLEWEALEGIGLDPENPWYRKYLAFADTLVKRAAGGFPVSHGALVGPADLAALLRGHSRSILDLLDEPEKAGRLLDRLGEIVDQVTSSLWRRLPLFQDGYFDAQYQLWAPGPIIRMQEDASALYSPDLYRRFLREVDRRLAARYPCSFMHLHSTSMFLLEEIVEIEEIGCFEINNDVGGPDLREMVPRFHRVQQSRRPLIIRGSFSPRELRLLLDALDPRGLYLCIMVKDLRETEPLRRVLGM